MLYLCLILISFKRFFFYLNLYKVWTPLYSSNRNRVTSLCLQLTMVADGKDEKKKKISNKKKIYKHKKPSVNNFQEHRTMSDNNLGNEEFSPKSY